MANSKITGLPVAGALAGTEPLPVVQAAATKQSTISAILTYITANISLAASAITSGALALARGGTGASLADPNADRILFWDDSAGAVDWLTAGTGLSISGTTMTVTVTGSTVNVFRANNTATQSISHNTATKVQFPTEAIDTGGYYDNATNYRWTPPSGKTTITGKIGYTTGTANAWILEVYKNGAAMTNANAVTRSAAANNETMEITISDSCNGTDYYEMWVTQFSGGSINLTAGNGLFTGLSFS